MLTITLTDQQVIELATQKCGWSEFIQVPPESSLPNPMTAKDAVITQYLTPLLSDIAKIKLSDGFNDMQNAVRIAQQEWSTRLNTEMQTVKNDIIK